MAISNIWAEGLVSNVALPRAELKIMILNYYSLVGFPEHTEKSNSQPSFSFWICKYSSLAMFFFIFICQLSLGSPEHNRRVKSQLMFPFDRASSPVSQLLPWLGPSVCSRRQWWASIIMGSSLHSSHRCYVLVRTWMKSHPAEFPRLTVPKCTPLSNKWVKYVSVLTHRFVANILPTHNGVILTV